MRFVFGRGVSALTLNGELREARGWILGELVILVQAGALVQCGVNNIIA
jgi:hypothetical protein